MFTKECGLTVGHVYARSNQTRQTSQKMLHTARPGGRINKLGHYLLCKQAGKMRGKLHFLNAVCGIN